MGLCFIKRCWSYKQFEYNSKHIRWFGLYTACCKWFALHTFKNEGIIKKIQFVYKVGLLTDLIHRFLTFHTELRLFTQPVLNTQSRVSLKTSTSIKSDPPCPQYIDHKSHPKKSGNQKS